MLQANKKLSDIQREIMGRGHKKSTKTAHKREHIWSRAMQYE